MIEALADMHKRSRSSLANGRALAADRQDVTERSAFVAQQHLACVALFNKSAR